MHSSPQSVKQVKQIFGRSTHHPVTSICIISAFTKCQFLTTKHREAARDEGNAPQSTQSSQRRFGSIQLELQAERFNKLSTGSPDIVFLWLHRTPMHHHFNKSTKLIAMLADLTRDINTSNIRHLIYINDV